MVGEVAQPRTARASPTITTGAMIRMSRAKDRRAKDAGPDTDHSQTPLSPPWSVACLASLARWASFTAPSILRAEEGA
jgi:hypothetical protein